MLITLGIIGVVAAMTIPTLVANYNTKSWNTAATVFDRKLEEALKTMNTQSTLAGHTTTESFVEELSKHFKTNKICQNDKLLDCFSDVVYWGGGNATPEEVDMSKIKVAKDFGQDDWNTNIVGVQFANGVSAMIAYNPVNCTQDPYSNRVTGGDCLAILYDTSGTKNPNTSGKDLRANGNVTKLGGTTCAFELDGICFGAPFYPTPVTKAECEAMISTHGIQGCERDNDYWAGAVKTCGGVSKMPTGAEIAKIANYVYNKTSISAETFESAATLDNDKSSSLGFDGGYFTLWSNQQESAGNAYIREFDSWYTGWTFGSKDYSYIYAVCKVD